MISPHAQRHVLQIREIKAHARYPNDERSTKNEKGRYRGTIVMVICEGCCFEWCTVLCATTPFASS
jgi:hypothetical protein